MPRIYTIELIDAVDENLNQMKQTQVITSVKIKHLLEHLRSALEYVANDTFEKYKPGQDNSKICFPYGAKKFIDNFFIKKLGVSNLNSFPLHKIFSSIQDYQTGETWLSDMCCLTNEVKHRNPLPLWTEESVKTFTLDQPGFIKIVTSGDVNIEFKNNHHNGIKFSDFTFKEGKYESSRNGHPLNISLTKDKKIRIKGYEYEVIPFIEKCSNELRRFVNLAYDELEKL